MRAVFRSFPQLRCRQYCYLRGLRLNRHLATAVDGLKGLQPTSSTDLELLTKSSPVIKLREYQEECIQSILTYVRGGHKRLGVSLATGTGKTVIFTQLIDRVQSPSDDVTQTLILVHRRELVEQAARHCSNAYPSKTIEIEMGNTHASGAADITIASVRSITSGSRMLKFDPGRFKLILVDEAHHIVAPGYVETLNHFGLMQPSPESPLLVGVSATMSRFDGLKLGAALDHIVYHKDFVDMIGEKWLSDVIFTTVKSKANLSLVKESKFGDFATATLSKAVNTEVTNDITFGAWRAEAGGRRSTIVFCVDLAHVSDLTGLFCRHGVDARYITGDTAKQIRSERLDAFKAGEFPVLINCGVFTEGTDIPNIDCVLLARPTRSRNLLVQMIGRGMRLHPGKQNCHVIDMVASLKSDIVTVPTLFGLDPAEIVSRVGVKELKDMHKRKTGTAGDHGGAAEVHSYAPPRNHLGWRVELTRYDSVFDLVEDTSHDRHIRSISGLAWVGVGADRYILSDKDGSFIELRGDDGSLPRYRIYHTGRVPIKLGAGRGWQPYRRSQEIAAAETFTDAVHAADTFASQTFPRFMIDRHQGWRATGATAGQLAFLNRMRDERAQLEESEISRGRAADMITKIKFGARGQLKAMKAAQKREVRAAAGRQLRTREEVRVGPLDE